MHEGDLPADYDMLSGADKQTLLGWIKTTLTPARTYHHFTSYQMKHDMERATRLYVSNGQFKGAMLASGYTPRDEHTLNWQFKVKAYAGQGTGA